MTKRPAGRALAIARAVARRLASAVAVMWGAVTVTFVALRLTPGSTIDAIIGQSVVTPAVRAHIIEQYGLNRPVWQQYLRYLGRLLRGDLGQSYSEGTSVASAIGQQLGSTMLLVAVGLGLAIGGSILVATATANRPQWQRGTAVTLERLSVAIPSFWLGILLLTVFSFQLHWFPTIGSNTVKGLVLPGIALALAPGAMLSQVLRQTLEATLDEPFIVTARARGLSATAVITRHALRHALMPVITLAGWLVAAFMGGAVVVETVFARQGLGWLTLTAIENKDFPLVSGLVLLSAATYVSIGFLVDALYPLLDPRLRESRADDLPTQPDVSQR